MRLRFDQFRVLKPLLRMLRDRRGVSAVTFAISFAVMAPMTLGVFDVYQINEQRGKLQDALDAAALYAAHSTATTSAAVDQIGDKALSANLVLIPGSTLKSSDFTLVTTDGITKVVAQASVQVPAYAPAEFVHNPIVVNTEVTRGGNNLEVALVLDNSTSMAGASLTSLQTAAKQLVDLVVSPNQTPYYSKISIVPYGNGVNVGSYATAARGAVLSATDPACINGANGLGCPSYSYFNKNGSKKTLAVSTCVSERTGSEAYTDAAPATAPVGFNYPATAAGNPCISAQMAPLNSDASAIKTSIDNLTACCSTGGHIGIAWGWYTLSPNWNSVFTGTSAPAAYTAPHTIKALVLMTDGEYNSVYCKGVIAKMGANSSSSGSGSDNDHINCLGTNGKDAYAQAQALCTAMKAPPNNIVVYTVGLNVLGTPAAADLVNNCATDAGHVYLPADGASLQVAFQQIGASLQQLRLSH